MITPPWQPLRTVPPAERILRLMAYFDIFAHPLTAAEIRGLGFGAAAPETEVAEALDALLSDGRIEASGELLCLAGRREATAVRRDKEARARDLWREVPAAVEVLSAFPFVRGLSITGTLAKDAVGEDADIDFVVFAADGRVWTCRTLVAAARRLMTETQRDRCCTNVFLAESALTYDQRTPYVAAEIGLSRPVLNPALGAAFLDANPWLKDFLPGIQLPPAPPVDVPPPPRRALTRAAERLLGGRVGDGLEALLPRVWGRFWALKYAHLAQEDRDRRFRVQATVSTNHYNNFQARVMDRYRQRLTELGLDPHGPGPRP